MNLKKDILERGPGMYILNKPLRRLRNLELERSYMQINTHINKHVSDKIWERCEQNKV